VQALNLPGVTASVQELALDKTSSAHICADVSLSSLFVEGAYHPGNNPTQIELSWHNVQKWDDNLLHFSLHFIAFSAGSLKKRGNHCANQCF